MYDNSVKNIALQMKASKRVTFSLNCVFSISYRKPLTTRKIKGSGVLGAQEKTSTTLLGNLKTTSNLPLKMIKKDLKEKRSTEKIRVYSIPNPRTRRAGCSGRDSATPADPAG